MKPKVYEVYVRNRLVMTITATHWKRVFDDCPRVAFFKGRKKVAEVQNATLIKEVNNSSS